MRLLKNRAGTYRKNLSGELIYRSFIPNSLPPTPELELDTELLTLLIETSRKLAELNSITKRIPNMNLFVSMYVRKEALMSSQIEGTQATLEDVLDPMLSTNTNQDVADVVNYIKATEYATERLRTLPLCNRLLRETHALLMENTRGQEKNPGEFRTSQNWIGGQGSTIKNARYIPPSPEDMIVAISNLEKYINNDESYDVLIRAALIHYQFETIHPFLDGNGRIGRLLIILYLIEKGALSAPVLYISYFLKKNRIEYYDRMTEVRTKGNYEQWVHFFLRAIKECAEDAILTVDKLHALHQKNIAIVNRMGRTVKNALLLFNYIEANPIIGIKKTSMELGVSYNTISTQVQRFIDANILIKTNSDNRNRTFSYEEYLDILRDGT